MKLYLFFDSNYDEGFELLSVVGFATSNETTTNNKRRVQMRSKRLLMGAAVIGCLAATMTSGAYAQEANTIGKFNARAGRQQPSTSAQPNASRRQRQAGAINEQFNARASSGRAMRGEHFTYARVSAQRYGRGERGLYARAGVDGGYRGEGSAYRDRAVGADVGVAADYGYRGRPLYAYAPTYEAGYAAGPYYNYAPGYEVAVTTRPYYTPGWNVAYASPYYDYAPGVSFGIGIGPVGIGVGPAWGW